MSQKEKTKKKKCSKCGYISKYPKKDFTKDKNRKDGLACWCRKCNTKNCRKAYKENKEEHLKKCKEWYRNNIEKAKESRRNYYKKNKIRMREWQKEYRKENVENYTEYSRRWRKNNPERYRETSRKNSRDWRKNNPEKSKLIYKKHRAKRRGYKTILLFQNPFKGKVHLHHVDNEYCVYIPAYIHQNFVFGPDRERHRAMLSQIVYDIYYRGKD